MQKFDLKLKNTPTNAPQVCSSVNSSLNKDQSLSVKNKVLELNNPDVDQSQHTVKPLKLFVYVISKTGKPLMPCSPAKAKRMLKKGAAHVIRRSPFTIQLNFDCEEKVQEVTLGIDSGAKNIGFSATTNKKELISGTVILDDRMKSRLDDRRMYRKMKRNRLWYRKPRWKNRVSSKKKGWLPPSILRKYQTHLTLINKIKNLLPITEVIIEVGNFDIQKIKNPNIKGKEYQEGDLLGYNNVKSYIFTREKYKCQLCRKLVIGEKTQLHHIIPRPEGTDKADNLALLHKKCHTKLHEQNLGKKLKKNKQYKEATFMNIIKNKFKKDLDCKLVFGYETFTKRNELNLPKSHINDAFVISGGERQLRTLPFEVTQKRKNNRCLQKNRKGFKPSIRRKRYAIRPKDLVKIKGKLFVVKGIHSYGKCINLVNKLGKIINKSVKKVDWVFHNKTLIWEKAITCFSPCLQVANKKMKESSQG